MFFVYVVIFKIESPMTKYFKEYKQRIFSEVGTVYLKSVSSTEEKRTYHRAHGGSERAAGLQIIFIHVHKPLLVSCLFCFSEVHRSFTCPHKADVAALIFRIVANLPFLRLPSFPRLGALFIWRIKLNTKKSTKDPYGIGGRNGLFCVFQWFGKFGHSNFWSCF